MKSKVYASGLILIIASFLACVVSFYLLIFCIPVYLLGIALIFSSKKSLGKKLLTTILPLIMYLPTTYLFLLAYNYSEPKVFLIPEGYEGAIRIVYEEKCGTTPIDEKGHKILSFPSNGILILNSKFDGRINNEYYFVNSRGVKTKINQSFDSKNDAKRFPVVQVLGAGTMDDGISFSDFYIYNKDTSYNEKYSPFHKFDSLTISEVRFCRSLKR